MRSEVKVLIRVFGMSAAMKQNGNLIDSWRVEGRECGGESKGQESFPFSACVMISFPKQNVDDHGQHGVCCISMGIVKRYSRRSHSKCLGISKVKVVYRIGSFGTCFKVATEYRYSS